MSQNEWNQELSVEDKKQGDRNLLLKDNPLAPRPRRHAALVAAGPDLGIRQKKNPLVIYHKNCADGFSAAWVFHHMQSILETTFDFHPGVYGEKLPDVADRVVYMVDFSYKRDAVIQMCKLANIVVLIDHHKTAIDDLSWLIDEGSPEHQSNFDWYVDLERSGATLAWDYWAKHIGHEFDIPDRPVLLGHIEDRDLWRFKLPNTREINANVFSFEYTFRNWDRLMRAGHSELLQMTVAGAAIERKHHKDIAELAEFCIRYMDFEAAGYRVIPVASLPYTLSSDAGRVLIELADKAGMLGGRVDSEVFAACYMDTADSRVFSLRSLPNGADVSAIAKVYGGGGHRNAAGFKVPRSHILAIY